MVDLQESRLDVVFHALGDVTRRRMLRRLAGGEHTVSQLAEPFNMSLAAASKHIKALEGAGLIRREIQGRTHVCRLNAEPLSSADEWLRYYEQFWSVRQDRLEGLLRGDSTTTPSSAGKARRSSPNPRKRSTR
jgi:DNA-binding transcriptional ArsR family regulator